jgi:hypothetical protein
MTMKKEKILMILFGVLLVSILGEIASFFLEAWGRLHLTFILVGLNAFLLIVVVNLHYSRKN